MCMSKGMYKIYDRCHSRLFSTIVHDCYFLILSIIPYNIYRGEKICIETDINKVTAHEDNWLLLSFPAFHLLFQWLSSFCLLQNPRIPQHLTRTSHPRHRVELPDTTRITPGEAKNPTLATQGGRLEGQGIFAYLINSHFWWLCVARDSGTHAHTC